MIWQNIRYRLGGLWGMICAAMIVTGLPAVAQEPGSRGHFSVRSQVIAPDLPGLTATIPGIGNGSRLSGAKGFEPVIYRTMLRTTQGSDTQIIADPSMLSDGFMLRDGALDGAEVEVLRIENGSFVSVRRSKIAIGGFHASGWRNLAPGRMLTPDQTSLQLAFSPNARSKVPYYYTVRAVDDQGRLSPPAKAVALNAPTDPGKGTVQPQYTKVKVDAGAQASLGAPQGLTGRLRLDKTVQLSWQPVAGAAGYMVFRSDYAPEDQSGFSWELEGAGPAIHAGDLVMLRARLMDGTRERMISNWEWNNWQMRSKFAPRGISEQQWNGASTSQTPAWEIRPHTADSPVTDGGDTYVHARVAQGQSFVAGDYNHSGVGQSWYQVLDPDHSYRAEIWLRGTPGMTVQFRVHGPMDGKLKGLPATFDLTEDWHKYSVDFQPTTLLQGDAPGFMGVVVSGNGTVDADNLRIFRADAGFLQLLPERRAALEASGMSDLRTHAFIKTGRRSYDLAQLTNPAGNISLWNGNTLPQTLQVIDQVKMNPWLQVEPHFSREEWLGLAEYLAAPASAATDGHGGKWVQKRLQQGRSAPWIDAFDHMRFEVGNETWNTLFRPWVFPRMTDSATGARYEPGAVYGMYQEYVLSILRDSPFWPALEPKLIPVLGGFNGFDYGLKAAEHSPHSAELTHAEYIGGWDQGEGPVSPSIPGLSSVLTFGVQMGGPNAKKYSDFAQDLSRKRDRPLSVGTYEAGPGYAMNGLNGGQVSDEQNRLQEIAMKSVAAGTATLDSFLLQAQQGYRVQNYFTFANGARWSSHAKWYHGGQAYPSWAWLALIGHDMLAGGDAQMLQVDTRDVPRMSLDKMVNRPAQRRAPMLASYAFSKGDKMMVVVLSRLLPDLPKGQNGHATVQVDLPFASAAQVTRYQMTGGYGASNAFADETQLVSQPLAQTDWQAPGSHDGQAVLNIQDLPPGEAFVYVFDGVQN
ncbi:hypothetical protein BFP70_05145 [Thioclava sp. SK-1]|uniref:hypothetical protein n=1 Tax=Thioclava sp. SK-1 TaxID=1889770 RepID=UPI0008252E7A|nr:hypothetical protein [Thioclava sp. SK-1]OCX66410.1 hypothetical protein BFP70_05145 [Thioclava sp. SK-1]